MFFHDFPFIEEISEPLQSSNVSWRTNWSTLETEVKSVGSVLVKMQQTSPRIEFKKIKLSYENLKDLEIKKQNEKVIETCVLPSRIAFR